MTIGEPILGRARGCWATDRGRFELDACGGAEVADLAGSSHDIVLTARGSAPWLGLFAAGGLGFRLIGPLSARFDVAAGLSPYRPEFVVAPYSDVYRPSLAYGRAELGLEVDLR